MTVKLPGGGPEVVTQLRFYVDDAHAFVAAADAQLSVDRWVPAERDAGQAWGSHERLRSDRNSDAAGRTHRMHWEG